MTQVTRRTFSRSGFREQLVSIFSIGILLLAIASSIAVSTLSSRSVHATLMEQGLQAAEAFAAQSTLALLYRSPENAMDAVSTTLAFPDIQAVAIYDLQHTQLLVEGRAHLMGPAPEWPDIAKLIRETDKEWEFMAPVYSYSVGADEEDSPFLTQPTDPKRLGYVRVIMGKETLHTLGGDILRGNFTVLMTLSGLLLLVLLAITTRLTRPLKNLSEFMQRAESGEKGVRAAIRGPSEIRNMEAVFNNMMDVLEAREEELKAARDLALESARLKGEFAANVSHELRTPLNSVLGMLELLSGMDLPPKQHEYVKVARSSGELLLSLIDDILDFSKIEAKKLEIEPVDFVLRETLDDVVALLAAQAQRKGLELGYVVAPEVPAGVVGDPTRIRQVLINLIGNAIKFTEAGEIAIGVSADRSKDDQVRVRFEVRDTGIGIAADARERIFQAFSQADGSTTRRYGGTGLGLAISSQLVNLMQGELGVDSTPGIGSTFWFVLPLRQSRREPEVGFIDRSLMAGSRVLVAEDSDINRNHLEQILSDWGVDYASTEDARTTVAMLREATAEGNPYEFLILDERLPGITGLDLARQVLDDDAVTAPRILVLSNAHATVESEELPANLVCINKPIRETVLLEALIGLRQPDGTAARQMAAAETAPPTEVPMLSGKHILIVEDNRANQHVAVGMLKRLGCSVEVAATGIEAVEAVSRRHHDAVLMDCQMPQMDGYQATAQIRALHKRDTHLPIIAMTANVQKGDAEKCFAAGMDDYLPKPLKLAALREALLRWFPEPLSKSDASVLEEDARVRFSNPAEAPVPVDVLSELRSNLGEAFDTMIEVFLEDAPEYIRRIKAALAATDPTALSEAAHSLRGSARNFGADRLSAVCRELEDCARQGSLQGAEALLIALHEAYRQLETVLQAEHRLGEVTRPARSEA